MKAKLKFDLSNEDDMIHYKQVNNAVNYHNALFEIEQLRRKYLKHFDGSDETHKKLEQVFDDILNIYIDNDVQLLY